MEHYTHYTILDSNGYPVGSVFATKVELSDGHYNFFKGSDVGMIGTAWYGYKNCETGQIVRLSDLIL